MIRVTRLAGAFGLVVALGACGLFGSSDRPPPCPKVFLASDTSAMVRFRDGPGRDITDVRFEAEILGYNGACTYDKGKLTVELAVDFAVVRGPAAEGPSARFNYFVAVPKLFPSPVGKQVFDVAFPYNANQRRGQFRDEIEIDIPLADRASGPSNEIYVGLQLDPDELEYNRKRRER